MPTGADLGARDAETAVKSGDLGLVLFIGAVVVIAAIVAARVAHGPACRACLSSSVSALCLVRRASASGSAMPG